MSTDTFELHIQQSLEKLENLWQRSYSIPHPENELWRQTTELPQQQQQLLQESLEELAASIEELQLASETLRQQNDELIASRQQIEAQRQYYQELFDLAPDCYFITSKEGTIKEANQKTTELLQVSPKHLSRKSLAVFIALDDRQQYYQILNQLKQGKISQATWQLEIVNRQQQVITAKCLVMAKRDRTGEIVNLRWRVSPFSSDSHNQDTTNLIPILVNSLRYPLYNLATQVEETISSNQSRAASSYGSLENISHDVFKLKQIVNNAYVIECLANKKDLHPALIDYSSFIKSLIKKVRKRPNFISEISLINLESCVGICDVFCLEQIIVNLLQLSSQQAAINP
ncbi:MAG: PAS domain-containing protein, partial [Cyanobacteria bacterium P01_A01_bin.83]